jgi:hypothetical protein
VRAYRSGPFGHARLWRSSRGVGGHAEELGSLHRLLQRLRPQRVPAYAQGAQVFLDYVDVLQRLGQRGGRPREAVAEEALVVLRAKLLRIVHALPALQTTYGTGVEARYVQGRLGANVGR